MTFRRTRQGKRTDWDMVVAGNGYSIAAWSQQLERDLPTVAEGYVGDIRTRVARNIATSLVARWAEWCVGNDEAPMTVIASGRDVVRWIFPVIDFPERPHALYERLVISDTMVGRWIVVGELPEEIAIEELHTVVEALLRHLLASGPGPNWPTLLGRAKRVHLLSGEDGRTLDGFNRLHRNRLKHDGQALIGPQRPEARRVLYGVLTAVERLLSRLP